MTFLPVVGRELQVAARKRSTFWLRVAAALVALIIGSGFLCVSWAGGIGTATLGKGLFGTLTWLALAGTLFAGLFFTSDALSEEKREGTLGLLFLTDLRGYDVVAGKLLATSLRGSYALLAFFPVLAVTLFMGGVTGVQFWKATLALVNALFFSLMVGLFVSSISRDSQRAMAGTLLLLLLLTAGGPMADSIFSSVRGMAFKPVLSLVSPVYVFGMASAWGRPPYWLGLFLSHALAWGLLALASVLVPRMWQDRAQKSSGSSAAWAYSWKYGRSGWRAALRRKLIDRNPVLWLACRARWQWLGIWMITICVLGALILIVLVAPSEFGAAWSPISWLLATALYLWTASQACQFFVESRRSGLIELLLVAPVDVDQIIQGQWRALLRMFGLPLVLLLVIHAVGASFSYEVSAGAVPQGGAAVSGLALAILAGVTPAITLAANILALLWFGMWMGLTSKNASLATLKTILFVQVIPWFVITAASAIIAALLMFRRSPSATMVVMFPLVMGGLAAAFAIAKDVAFLLLARRRLYASFREQALRSAGSAPSVPPILAPQPVTGA